MAFIEQAIPIAIVFLVLNAGLLVMGIPDTQTTSDIQSTLFGPILPSGMQDYENIDPTHLSKSQEAMGQSGSGFSQEGETTSPGVGQLLLMIPMVLSILIHLIFGFTFTLLSILPTGLAPFVWIVSIPIVVLELAASLWLLLTFISTIRGLLPI